MSLWVVVGVNVKSVVWNMDKKLAYHNNSPVKKKNVVLYNIIYHKYEIMEILTFLNFMAKLSDIEHGIIKP